MKQDDNLVAHVGQLARFISYVMDHFWFIVSGLVAVVLWGVLAMVLQLSIDPIKACGLAALITVSSWAVVFCLFMTKAMEQTEEEPLSNS